MLGLDHEVDRRERHGRRLVGHHDHLGRPGEAGWDPHDARHLALGQSDVHVARSHDDVDRPHGLRAVGERGDRLRAPDPVHLVDARDGGRRERRRGHPTVGSRRHTQGQLAHARNPRR